jgi:hypothetical protein
MVGMPHVCSHPTRRIQPARNGSRTSGSPAVDMAKSVRMRTASRNSAGTTGDGTGPVLAGVQAYN